MFSAAKHDEGDAADPALPIVVPASPAVAVLQRGAMVKQVGLQQMLSNGIVRMLIVDPALCLGQRKRFGCGSPF